MPLVHRWVSSPKLICIIIYIILAILSFVKVSECFIFRLLPIKMEALLAMLVVLMLLLQRHIPIFLMAIWDMNPDGSYSFVNLDKPEYTPNVPWNGQYISKPFGLLSHALCLLDYFRFWVLCSRLVLTLWRKPWWWLEACSSIHVPNTPNMCSMKWTG